MNDVGPREPRHLVPTPMPGELWMGSTPYAHDLKTMRTRYFVDPELEKFNLIVNATWELAWPGRADGLVLRIPLNDLRDRAFNVESMPDQVRATASLVAGALTNGWRVFVHCNMGLNRSGLVCARALMFMGATATEAIDTLRNARHPLVLFNNHFVRWLAEEEGTLITAETSMFAEPPTMEQLDSLFVAEAS